MYRTPLDADLESGGAASGLRVAEIQTRLASVVICMAALEHCQCFQPCCQDITAYPDLSREGRHQFLGAVKSPCGVNGKIYDVSKNMTTFSEATAEIHFRSPIETGNTYENDYQIVEAPEECIYRHSPQFGTAISTFFNKEMFNGYCLRSAGFLCTNDRNDSVFDKAGYLPGHGAGTVLTAIHVNGKMSYDKTSQWFSSFTNAMKSRFRFQFGSSSFYRDPRGDFEVDESRPRGRVHGLTWRTTLCVSIHKSWLVLPICLTLLTTLMSMAMIFKS